MAKLTLYHGSNHIIGQPVYGLGNRANDYGPGFYCTQDIELAKEWSVTETADGFVNAYVLETDGLSVLELDQEPYTVLNWLCILVQNRSFKLSGEFMPLAKRYLLEFHDLPYREYDIISGWRADDSYFSYATSFLDNRLTLASLERAMKLGNLGKQIVLISPESFRRVRFIGSENVSREAYYNKKTTRDSDARKAWREDVRTADIIHGTTIQKLMAHDWGDDDDLV
jgi:hypothetical protein